MEQSLEQVIRQYVHLPPHPNSKGWYPCVHIGGCDRGHKGPRAAFNFTDGAVAFHCFNCGVATVFDSTSHSVMPEKMVTVLNDFGIPEEEWRPIIFNQLGKQLPGKKKQRQQIHEIEPKSIDVPEPFCLLDNTNDKWATVAKEYLSEVRNIDPSAYPFMVCRPDKNKKIWERWQKRVIIPIYKDNNLVFYQGRGLTDTVQPKYLSPGIPKERILYGYDKIQERTDKPLYVVEGWFDAYKIDGVALLGNEISSEQSQWLNRTPRKKVYIPDKTGNGKQAALHALQLGWSVSTPDVGNCKDMSDAVDKYGLLYVLKTITEHTYNDEFEARTRLGIYCD